MWQVAKALQVPLDNSIKYLTEIPYTISFVIRKLRQLDSFNELGKEKRPPDDIIWEGSQEDIDSWIDRVIYKKEPQQFKLDVSEIEG